MSTSKLKKFAIIPVMLGLVSCASTPETVPLKIYSEPAGGYVIYRVDEGGTEDSPWIYLGTTPLESSLKYDKHLTHAKKVSFKIMKEGYFTINKDWESEILKNEVKERNMIFWNPGLVRQNSTVTTPYQQ
jgi:hypothetical protein